LILPPDTKLHTIVSRFQTEIGAAENIKSRLNRQSIVSVMKSVQAKLKTYSACPAHGLVILSGEVSDTEGKPKKILLAFEPPLPIHTSVYYCGDHFETTMLHTLLDQHDVYGFIIIDGKEIVVGTLCGNHTDVLFHQKVDLPKKHNKGGQSSARFGRLYQEKRHNYITKSLEHIADKFLVGGVPTVVGFIVAGPAELKYTLAESPSFPLLLKPLVKAIYDTSYGGIPGFKEAIRLSSSLLTNEDIMKEISVLSAFFKQIQMNTATYMFGHTQVMNCLRDGIIETLLVWEKYEAPSFGEDETFMEWLCTHTASFGAKLVLISDRSSEGSQFVKGFGGFGAILRYAVSSSENMGEEEPAENTHVEEEHEPSLSSEDVVDFM
jgi:peptide chain release factor subunit 1